MVDRLRRYPWAAGALAFALLGGAVLLFFNQMAFSNLILARGDTFLYFYPYWHAAADALRAGRVPLWNPAIFMGVPFLANSQVGFFYPLNWPVWAWLATPYAVSAAILSHVFLAGAGTFLAARRWLQLSLAPALLAALSFALGGYLTAQVEHVNQIQGLAWLPWFIWVLGGINDWELRSWLRGTLALALLFSLQLLAGHTQTAFITGTAVLVWIGAVAIGEGLNAHRMAGARWWARPAALAAGGGLALLLTAVQLLPTLELAGLSSRAGGLAVNEVLSFSLPPLHLTRSLLPGYSQSLFSEYVAFLPLTFLALAFLGGWRRRKQPAVLASLLLVAAGLLLALGAYNPLYWLLARLPGFDLFRVPARWLVLYALGISLLVGVGAEVLARAYRSGAWRERLRPLRWFLALLLLFILWGWLGRLLVPLLPPGAEAPYEAPGGLTVLGWSGELLLLFALLLLAGRRPGVFPLPAVAALGLGFLFWASRSLPYNNLTTPEAYFDLRPPTTRLQIMASGPPDRFLSLSETFFDPGDQEEIRLMYAGQLSEEALYDYIVAIKQKEIVAPNLPLIYGLAAVDGFDGGILPLRSYTQQMTLLLPPGTETTDGRLREQLRGVPEQRWLSLYNARHVITDKTGDEWRDGVFYDRQHPLALAPDESAAVGFVPAYTATELRLLATALPGPVRVTAQNGEVLELDPQSLGEGLFRVPFPRPLSAREITLRGCRAAACSLQALTLVDARDSTFLSLVPGSYRLIHSGDVKIYENLEALPRAFMVSDWQWAGSPDESLELMRAAGFAPEQTAVLLRPGEDTGPLPVSPVGGDMRGGTAEILRYAPEEVVIRTEGQEPGLLVLSDTAYPGWTALVDGDETPIYAANGLFRAVFVPGGSHEVQFLFSSETYRRGAVLSLAGLVVLLLLGLFALYGRARNGS